ncbi:glycosyltransferase family 2 protein [Paenibacillus sp. BC26]|uniref:glycosyltransferase family 2 protein n=1 Tax=Paenibacillus sp. BC26 TaxID=1881032 RepID=UPI0008E42EB5|nr:glycosyltransferase family 2 protein [Paenibacillus sp. BC26]SFS71375.1 Glycosyl transferase family 2 [Paenibacillus sp. BC26]
MTERHGRITLSMVVRNEAGRYLRRALLHHREFIDAAVIIDDCSDDDTVAICQEMLAGIPVKIVINERSEFSNEIELRKRQWEETAATNPEWILNLDADEIFEANMRDFVPTLVNQHAIDTFAFRLYDMWSETHYREDSYWQAHLFYRPFLVRYRPEAIYRWKETPQHCGRFPLTVLDFPFAAHEARLMHFGWATPEDRQHKYDRYMRLDLDAKYGWKAQYDSILDPAPLLKAWSD